MHMPLEQPRRVDRRAQARRRSLRLLVVLRQRDLVTVKLRDADGQLYQGVARVQLGAAGSGESPLCTAAAVACAAALVEAGATPPTPRRVFADTVDDAVVLTVRCEADAPGGDVWPVGHASGRLGEDVTTIAARAMLDAANRHAAHVAAA